VADNSAGDLLTTGGYLLDPTQELVAESELGITVAADGTVSRSSTTTLP
jgi:hypothetical protein